MIGVEGLQRLIPNLERQSALGTPARLTLFFWSLAMVLLMPIARLPLAGGLVLLVTAVLYPTALRRLFRWRWLIFALLLLLPPLLWSGTAGAGLAGQESFFPWAGLVIGLQMVLRMVVVVVAVDGLSGAVDVAEVAGLLERCGLRGLGFAVGVAINLLPVLRRSVQTTWHSLRMRGGLRAQWWRGLQLLLVTVLVNGLRQAENIALAAEARAFTPERAAALPLKQGRYDGYMIVALLFCWLLLQM
jgi:energy-coupling factor transporter transmembrane protein EcfT